LAPHVVTALNGIDVQWKAGQSPRVQFEVSFAELEEFKKARGTTYFFGKEKKKFPKLASWTFYSKSTAIKVLNKEATNFVFTLLRIKKLVDICCVPLYHYKYEDHADDDEDADDDEEADEADADIWSGGTGKEQQQGNDCDDYDDYDEEQPVDEDQEEPVDEEQAPGDDEENDDDMDTTDDNYRKPAAADDVDDDDRKPAANMEGVFDNDLTQSTEFWKCCPVCIGTCPVSHIELWKFYPVCISTFPVGHIGIW
jgi:hypothetical protein